MVAEIRVKREGYYPLTVAYLLIHFILSIGFFLFDMLKFEQYYSNLMSSLLNLKYLFHVAVFGSILNKNILGYALLNYGEYSSIFILLAGFIGCLGIAILEILSIRFGSISKNSSSISTIVIYGIFGLFSLYIGHIILYLFMDIGAGQNMSPFEVMSLYMFFSGNIGIKYTLLALAGAILASLLPLVTSSKTMNK